MWSCRPHHQARGIVDRSREPIQLGDHEHIAITGVEVFQGCNQGWAHQGLARDTRVGVHGQERKAPALTLGTDRGFLGKETGVQVLVSLGADLSQLRQNALQLLAVEEPLHPGETGTGAYDLSDMSGFGTVPVGQRQGVPWWRPFLARHMRRWQREHPFAR